MIETDGIADSDRLDDSGESRVDGRNGLCRVCLILMIALHPEVANLLIG